MTNDVLLRDVTEDDIPISGHDGGFANARGEEVEEVIMKLEGP